MSEMGEIRRVIVMPGLKEGHTANSALENYALGLCGGFREVGLAVYPLETAAINYLNQQMGFKVPPLMRISKYIGGAGAILEAVYAVQLAFCFWAQRRETAIFVTNASRRSWPFVAFFHRLGFPIAYWIVDYYPGRKELTNQMLARYSDLTIVINEYIAAEVPQNAPVCVFHGGTYLKEPEVLSQPNADGTFRLFYAGKLNRLNAIDELLDIVAEDCGLSLTLFGDGELSALAESYAKRHSNIRTNGLRPRAEVIAEMAKADGVLSLRRLDDDYYKGFFPSKLIEMIASPAPVLVSDMGLVTQAFAGAVTFVYGPGAAGLRAAINEVKNLSQDQLDVQHARRTALIRETFDWSRIASLVRSMRKAA